MTQRHCNDTRNIFTSLLMVATLLSAPLNNANARTCSLDELARAVDEVGASLRNYNQEAMPQILKKMQQLQDKKGWSQTDGQKQTTDYLHDAKIAQLDENANRHLSKIDSLGPREEDTADTADCARISELRAAGIELLAIMKAKTSYTLTKIQSELAPGTNQAKPASSKTTGSKTANSKTTRATPRPSQTPIPAQQPPPSSPPEVAANAPPADPGPWQTDLKRSRRPKRSQKGYTIDEIRSATRGFFGTISTNLATVLQHAFTTWGEPSAYVLGNEGGGAFLAGLRYGKGTLYLRKGGRRKVYWHGPSLGTDIGAAGSRTMFLIYNLKNPDYLYRSYTGIDGSAYLVGGVGITFLKGGKTIMAPIRSGVGLRLGANLGYVRFTRTATWNPF